VTTFLAVVSLPPPGDTQLKLFFFVAEFTHGAYPALLQELDEKECKNFLRMDRESFELLLNKVGPSIQWQDTRLRLSVAPEERLAMTL